MKKVRIGILGSGFSAHFQLCKRSQDLQRVVRVAAILRVTKRVGVPLAGSTALPASSMMSAPCWRQPRSMRSILRAQHVTFRVLGLEAARHGKHVICEKPAGRYFGPAVRQRTGPPKATRAKHARAGRRSSNGARGGRTRRHHLCYAENWVYAPPIAKLNRLMAASGSTVLRIEGEEWHSGSHAPYSRRWQTAGGGSLLRLCGTQSARHCSSSRKKELTPPFGRHSDRSR